LERHKDEDGTLELRPQLSPAEQLNADALQERWAQRYLKEEFTSLGFTKVEGPFNRGHDYRVLHKRRWLQAEVETRWENYRRHGHHLNPAFDGVEYLILLSAKTPPPDALDHLPPRIVHINLQHFLAWYEKAVAPEMLGKEFRALVVGVWGAFNPFEGAFETVPSPLRRSLCEW
jgi:hypothetical protein